MPNQNEPKDLKVKVGTKEEVFWTEIRVKSKQNIINLNHQIELEEVIKDYAEHRIKEEKDILKS